MGERMKIVRDDLRLLMMVLLFLIIFKGVMMIYSREELKARAFRRAADALFSFWEEQKDCVPRTTDVHSRLFDTLIYDQYIQRNQRKSTRTYKEHVVPCAYIRNLAFEMYWNGRSREDVSVMIGRLLCIVYITPDEARIIDSKHKSSMPVDWNPECDSIFRRLEDAAIEIQYD